MTVVVVCLAGVVGKEMGGRGLGVGCACDEGLRGEGACCACSSAALCAAAAAAACGGAGSAGEAGCEGGCDFECAAIFWDSLSAAMRWMAVSTPIGERRALG